MLLLVTHDILNVHSAIAWNVLLDKSPPLHCRAFYQILFCAIALYTIPMLPALLITDEFYHERYLNI